MPEKLTKRQIEFLVLVAQGLNRGQIAKQTSFSVWTVKAYLNDARVALKARTLAQAVARAIAFEIIGIDHEGNAFVPTDEVTDAHISLLKQSTLPR